MLLRSRKHALALLLALVAVPAMGAASAPETGPATPLARHIKNQLPEPEKPGESWCFGVIADPHIYLYKWNDRKLAGSLRSWKKAGAKFGVVVGDLGTGKSLRPDGDGETRQMDKFARTIASVEGCPPVVLSMGNHELDGDGKKAWLDALYPDVIKGVEGNGNHRFFYYSFDYRGCHFVCLDANHIPRGGRRAALGVIPEHEFQWLEKDLEAHRGKLTFVFLHEPVEQIHYDTPYYLLKNRARLIGILRRFPDVRWVFHGHLHYADWVKAWGLNILHCGGWIVRVEGRRATVVTKRKPFDLGAVLAGRVSEEAGQCVYRIAEDRLEPAGRNCSLKKHVSLVGAEKGVTPTRGKTMLRIQKTLGARGRQSFTHLRRYLLTWDVLPIVEGMTFSYDVRCVDSVYDNIALQLRITMPAGQKRPKLKDQTGLPMENVHQYHSPSLKGRADQAWLHREVDLSELAGGWIDMVTLCGTRPNGAPYPEGELRVYIDNIRFTWPAEANRYHPEGREAEQP
jgi:hypothetical protein